MPVAGPHPRPGESQEWVFLKRSQGWGVGGFLHVARMENNWLVIAKSQIFFGTPWLSFSVDWNLWLNTDIHFLLQGCYFPSFWWAFLKSSHRLDLQGVIEIPESICGEQVSWMTPALLTEAAWRRTLGRIEKDLEAVSQFYRLKFCASLMMAAICEIVAQCHGSGVFAIPYVHAEITFREMYLTKFIPSDWFPSHFSFIEHEQYSWYLKGKFM